MSEEMNKREAELNEQSLEGVSGGIDQSAYDKAKNLCAACCSKARATGTCNRKHEADLIRYIAAHGLDSVGAPEQCPSYNR